MNKVFSFVKIFNISYLIEMKKNLTITFASDFTLVKSFLRGVFSVLPDTSIQFLPSVIRYRRF